jgi:hypothetical protein
MSIQGAVIYRGTNYGHFDYKNFDYKMQSDSFQKMIFMCQCYF